MEGGGIKGNASEIYCHDLRRERGDTEREREREEKRREEKKKREGGVIKDS